MVKSLPPIGDVSLIRLTSRVPQLLNHPTLPMPCAPDWFQWALQYFYGWILLRCFRHRFRWIQTTLQELPSQQFAPENGGFHVVSYRNLPFPGDLFSGAKVYVSLPENIISSYLIFGKGKSSTQKLP